MTDKIKSLVEQFTANPKRLFLVDGSGAFLTAFFLILVRIAFEDAFGMPARVLYFLSLAASIYAAYSFCCYFFIRSKWRAYLKGISIANMLYCCLTIGLILYFYQSLTIPGIIYFLLEVVLMSGLVWIEVMTASRLA